MNPFGARPLEEGSGQIFKNEGLTLVFHENEGIVFDFFMKYLG